MTGTPEVGAAIHGRFVRLFIDHKVEARVADLSDAEIVEQAGGRDLHRTDGGRRRGRAPRRSGSTGRVGVVHARLR